MSVLEYVYRKKFNKKEFFDDKSYQSHFISNLNDKLGNELIDKIDVNCQNTLNKKEFLRFLLKQMIPKLHPLSYLILRGFDKFNSRIDIDEKQILKESDLLEFENKEISSWWLDLKKLLRSQENKKKQDLGEDGEEASKNFEEKRIKNLGINNRVKRISFFDESKGYDIESWDLKDNKTIQIFIEVKNESFIFKSGQWREALSKKNSYFAHYWTEKCNKLRIIDYQELHEAVTKQLKEKPVAGYDWQLTIPFPEGKPVEDYF